jgi:hypothetical protein
MDKDKIVEILKEHYPLESAAGEAGDAGCSCAEVFSPYTWEGWCNHVAGKIMEESK